MLWKVNIHYDDGRETDELVHSETPISIYPQRDSIKSAIVSRFMYEVEHYMSPTLYNANDGKRYIIPVWKEVHPDTGFEDIKWIKPTPPKEKKVTKKIEGSMGVYKTSFDPKDKKYKCTCMGFWRSKGNCKHVKDLKASLAK